jgi:acyl-[acyl-carrier-protein]-phospholipid O-acyltransferase/long-chain-fatty-acid--[acyl-carrier-protein] ligase
MFKKIVRWVLARLYRVDVTGLEHFAAAGERVLIVANHTSFLDPVLLWAFLPEEVTFAINTYVAQSFVVRQALRFVQVFPMDPTQPMSVKALTHYIRQNRKAVLFPEGRITVTGALMKIYDGAGMVADKADAAVLPIRIDGAQYTPFSRMHGIVRLRWFPKITLNLLPPRRLSLPPEIKRDHRRKLFGMLLEDIMSGMVFETGNYRRTLIAALLEARSIHGGKRVVLEDMQHRPLTYDTLILRAQVLGRKLESLTQADERIGLILPNACATVVALLGLQMHRRVPAFLNYSAGVRNMRSACETAQLRTLLTSRRFVEMAKLESDLTALKEQCGARILYLEDLAAEIGIGEKLRAWIDTQKLKYGNHQTHNPDAPAVILFTSGSEGAPKGVVLSHANLLANRAQLTAKVDFNAQDRILNFLPLFHSFGLAVGTLLPLLSGMYTFLYPSPLHYRIIPEIAYDINATILFGTNTFLTGYVKHAHPYDFYSVRYVFAGAEKLQAETRRQWSEKFGIRILEAYGVTETSPALTVNTPMHYQSGSVGRLLPGLRYVLEPVEGIETGGRLHVQGPNVMLGYLLPGQSGEWIPASSSQGAGWHDTGDLAEIDEEGFVTIKGRAKRFAKIGGEMVSLAAVEELAGKTWPQALHAAIAVPDAKKGEQIILFTSYPDAQRGELAERARQEGFSEIYLPRNVRFVESMPVLATGKLDYQGLQALGAGETEA